MEVFNAPVPKWCKALEANDIQKYLEKASDQLDSKSYNHSAWFFGSKEEFPMWTGYTLGYLIVKKYLKRNQRMNVAKLVNVSAKSILEAL